MKLLKKLLLLAIFSISLTSCTDLEDDDSNINIENTLADTGEDKVDPDGGKD
ncbi:hypothetical protein [Polaribacter sp. Hel_I_88]|uniref:hypothetical protein n=1 Tax=Polaribacter sp. Hel_I_88 TaxID=1250006 RepID=UPI000AB350E3|nr:hypothetical protein [Polaribacter sp. Hel_I_88]